MKSLATSTLTARAERSNCNGRARSSLALRLVALLCATSLPLLTSAQVSFVDTGGASGTTALTESYGASWADINNDGFVDLFVSNHRNRPSIYRNNGNGTFTDIGGQVNSFRNRQRADTHGGSFADFDNDGDQDLLITTGINNQHQFLVNNNGQLTERTQEYNIAFPEVGGRLPIWYDHNNDGLLDAIVTQYAGIAKVYTNLGSTFADQRQQVRLICDRIHYGVLLDVNNDDHLDLVCADEQRFPQAVYNMRPQPWVRLNNRLPEVDTVVDSIVGDFDNDLLQDIFVLNNTQTRASSAIREGNRIEARWQGGRKSFDFVSDGPINVEIHWNKQQSKVFIGANGYRPNSLNFTLNPNEARNRGMPMDVSFAAAPAILIGFNNNTKRWTIVSQTENKWSDSYIIVTSTAPISDFGKDGFWGTDRAQEPTLIRQIAPGNFAIRTAGTGLDAPVLCASSTTGDYDNDRDLDIYLACREGSANTANIMYWNNGDGTFTRNVGASGAGGVTGLAVSTDAGTADSAVTADIHNDGFLDIFVANGLSLRPEFTGGPGQIFRNQGNDNRWIMLDLEATQSAKDAIGARVIATTPDGMQQIRVLDGGYHRWSHEHRRIHFGLGLFDSVDIRIEWPSGTVNTHQAVAVRNIYRARENGGLQSIGSVEPPGAAECGAPSYNPATEPGIYVYPDCSTGRWTIEPAGGGSFAWYEGDVTSAVALENLQQIGIETNDTVDNTTDPRVLNFRLAVSGGGIDTLRFDAVTGANNCLRITGPASAAVFYGANKTPMAASFDLDTLEPCGSGPAQPLLLAGNATGSESNATVTVPVQLSQASTDTIAVDVDLMDDTATAGLDYVSFATTTLTFAPGETSKSLAVALIDDDLTEGPEQFKTILSNPVNAVVSGTGEGVVTIQDNEARVCGVPTYDVRAERGLFVYQDCTTGTWTIEAAGGGGAFANFRGTLVATDPLLGLVGESIESTDELDNSTDPAIVAFQFKVVGGGADALRFQLASGAAACLTLEAPTSEPVLFGPDKTPLPNTFDLLTQAPCGVAVLSIGDVTANEDDGSMTFDVLLSAPAEDIVTLDYATANLTATAGADYVANSGSLSIAVGDTSAQITVDLIDDSARGEGDERFEVALTRIVGADDGQSVAVGTIIDDEVIPQLTVADVSAAEGDGVLEFLLNLSAATTFDVSVDLAVANGSASQGDDFTLLTPNPVTIPASQTQAVVQVSLVDDSDSETSETFQLLLSNPVDVQLPATNATGTIIDNDAPLPELSVSDVQAAEGAGALLFTVELSAASPVEVTFTAMTTAGTADAGVDFESLNATFAIPAGNISAAVAVPLIDDGDVESAENLSLQILNATGALIAGGGTATGTIQDDDAAVCGAPTFNPATEKGVFVSIDCATGVLRVEASAGGSYTQFDGLVRSSQPILNLVRDSVETSDSINENADPAIVDFSLKVSGNRRDAFEVELGTGASSCIDLTAPTGGALFFGVDKMPMPASFDLSTLGACSL